MCHMLTKSGIDDKVLKICWLLNGEIEVKTLSNGQKMGFLLGLLGQDVGKLLMWGFFGEIIDKMWELFGENVDFCPDIPHICSCPAHSIEHRPY